MCYHSAFQCPSSFPSQRPHHITPKRSQKWICRAPSSDNVKTATARVRFINTPDTDSPIETQSESGKRLLDVGDAVGVHIPRGCQSGICGTCTVDIDGLAGRACQFRVESSQDIEVDCWRMSVEKELGEVTIDPMKRFEGVEQGLVSKEDMSALGRQNPGVSECENCEGVGEVDCPSCGGSGVEWSDITMHCMVCAGRRRTCCAFCQGTGFTSVRPF